MATSRVQCGVCSRWFDDVDDFLDHQCAKEDVMVVERPITLNPAEDAVVRLKECLDQEHKARAHAEHQIATMSDAAVKAQKDAAQWRVRYEQAQEELASLRDKARTLGDMLKNREQVYQAVREERDRLMAEHGEDRVHQDRT